RRFASATRPRSGRSPSCASTTRPWPTSDGSGGSRRAEQPPREDRGEDEVAGDGEHGASLDRAREPAGENDRERRRLADRSERHERPIEVWLQGEPGVRAGEEHDEEREQRRVGQRDGRWQTGEATEGRREQEEQGAPQVEERARPE